MAIRPGLENIWHVLNKDSYSLIHPESFLITPRSSKQKKGFTVKLSGSYNKFVSFVFVFEKNAAESNITFP